MKANSEMTKKEVCRKVSAELKKLETRAIEFNLENEGKWFINIENSLGASFGYDVDIKLYDIRNYEPSSSDSIKSREFVYLGGSSYKYKDCVNNLLDVIKDMIDKLDRNEFNPEIEIIEKREEN